MNRRSFFSYLGALVVLPKVIGSAFARPAMKHYTVVSHMRPATEDEWDRVYWTVEARDGATPAEILDALHEQQRRAMNEYLAMRTAARS